VFHSPGEDAGCGPHPARHLASAGRECSWAASPEPWICHFPISSRKKGVFVDGTSCGPAVSKQRAAARTRCQTKSPTGLPWEVEDHASAPSRSSHLGAHLAFRTVPHPSTHELDTVIEEQCAVCELPAVVTSTMSTSPHWATYRFTGRGSWATKRWHRCSSLKRNHTRVPWLLEFIRQYRGGHGSGAVGAGLWRRSERRPH